MMDSQMQRHRITRICTCGVILTALLFLPGCFRSSSSEAAGNTGPITLTPNQASAQGNTVLSSNVDEAALRQAIGRYRIIKQRAASPYNFAGADLNGDSRPEVLVLFSGPDWCQRTGCSLVIFQMEKTGYKVVSHIVSAKAPVAVGPDASFGWRDLIVRTGGAGVRERNARLVFAGRGYPTNALLQPEPTNDTISQAQQIIASGQPTVMN